MAREDLGARGGSAALAAALAVGGSAAQAEVPAQAADGLADGDRAGRERVGAQTGPEVLAAGRCPSLCGNAQR